MEGSNGIDLEVARPQEKWQHAQESVTRMWPLDLKSFEEYVYKGRRTTMEEMQYIEGYMLPKLKHLIGQKKDFYTFWLGVNQKWEILTEFVFKGEPDKDGMVEIGCHTPEKMRNKGYMTQAVRMMSVIAKGMGVKGFVAFTKNKASIRALAKCEFELAELGTGGEKNGEKKYIKIL